MVKLPNELVGSIIDNLYFDRDALLNCALVGRAWVYSSQRGIFRQIVLDLTSVHMWSIYLEMTERLISSFDANPSLASYVRSFKLLTAEDPPEPAEAATANIVHRLANLNVEKVALDLDEWNGVSPSLKEALVNMLRAHSVTRLSLTRFLITFKDLASLLSHMPHLKMLDLGIFFQDWDVPNSSLESNVEGAVASTAHCPPRSIQLHQLRLASENELISFATWFQQDWCPFAVGNLKLCIICTVYSEAAIDMLKLQQLGTKVRELKLPGQETFNSSGFHLGYTPNLHSLTLDLWQTDIHTPVPSIQSLFTPLLESPDSQDEHRRFPLRHLTIDLKALHSGRDPQESHQWKQWALVDAILAKADFAQLETVDT